MNNQSEKPIKMNYKELYKKEKKRREDIEKILELKNRELEDLKHILQEKNIKLENTKNTKTHKGSQCSVSGSNYEKQIYNITNNCYIKDIKFNTQNIEELGGSSSKNDINCNYKDNEDIGIEVKKYNTPDWMQSSIKFDFNTKIWKASKGKNSTECQNIFNNIINNLKLYDGNIPPFMEKSITHEEWKQIKKETNKWNDTYIDIHSDTIRKLYSAKGCKYIQISDGYGLYHLGTDVCGFDVPLFDIDQQIRIRTKIHTRKNKKGFCNLSVTIACQPKNIKNLVKSKYSLDNKDKLPIGLIYNSNQ